MATERKRLNARDLRAKLEVEIDIGGGTTVKARRVDMTLMLMEGLMPTPLLNAVQRLIDAKDAPHAERAAIIANDSKPFMDMLRKHALVAVLDPKLTEHDTGEPDTLPVSYLDMTQLMAIWQATAVVPKVGAADAETFRQPASDVADPVARAGEDVQPAAEQLDQPGVAEVITG